MLDLVVAQPMSGGVGRCGTLSYSAHTFIFSVVNTPRYRGRGGLLGYTPYPHLRGKERGGFSDPAAGPPCSPARPRVPSIPHFARRSFVLHVWAYNNTFRSLCEIKHITTLHCVGIKHVLRLTIFTSELCWGPARFSLHVAAILVFRRHTAPCHPCSGSQY